MKKSTTLTAKKLFVICAFLGALPEAHAQIAKQDTLFYDKNWKGVESKAFAEYYRILSNSSDSHFGKRCRDYYITGELQSESGYISIDKYDDSKSVMDGEWVNYYKSGQTQAKGTRKNGVGNGEYTEYYENGLIKTHKYLINGKADGILSQFDEKGDMCTQTEMVDGYPKYDYYVLSNKDGFGCKYRISDNSPIWESPSYEEIKTEYKDGEAWSYYIKNGLMVAMNNSQVKDYGKWYRIQIAVSNNSIAPIDFDPDKIASSLKKTDGSKIALEIYSSDQYMKKVRRSQNWKKVLHEWSEGQAAAQAGYSTSTTKTNSSYDGYSNSHGNASAYGSGGYAQGNYSGNSTYHSNSSTTAETVTYDGAAAYQARVIASDRMANYENALLQERQIKQEGYLKRTTIYPGQAISGYINIKRVKGESMEVVLDINGAKYSFQWNL